MGSSLASIRPTPRRGRSEPAKPALVVAVVRARERWAEGEAQGRAQKPVAKSDAFGLACPKRRYEASGRDRSAVDGADLQRSRVAGRDRA